MTTRLSSLQYSMLKMFATEPSSFRMPIETAGQFRQDSFRSMLMRGYIEYQTNSSKKGNVGFHITAEGQRAYHEFEVANILRRIPSLTLTSYFHHPRVERIARRAS